jgi:hypothetical protein
LLASFFSLTAQLPGKYVFGDDRTHLDAAQIQILCLIIIHTFGHVIDTRRHIWACNRHSRSLEMSPGCKFVGGLI